MDETTLSGAAPAGLPQVALGGRPSDAFKRPKRMKLKKISESDNKPKLSIKKDDQPKRSVEFEMNWSYGKKHEMMPKQLPKIKVVKLKEEESICVCSHDNASHKGHECKECSKAEKYHKFKMDVDFKPSAFINAKTRPERRNLMGQTLTGVDHDFDDIYDKH